MSHHLDSPIARQDVRLDITDLYVFRGETGTVFAINVCHSIAPRGACVPQGTSHKDFALFGAPSPSHAGRLKCAAARRTHVFALPTVGKRGDAKKTSAAKEK